MASFPNSAVRRRPLPPHRSPPPQWRDPSPLSLLASGSLRLPLQNQGSPAFQGGAEKSDEACVLLPGIARDCTWYRQYLRPESSSDSPPSSLKRVEHRSFCHVVW